MKKLKSNPIVKVEDILRVNFSSISTYLRCPKQYEFRYVKQMKEPPAIALIEGSSHHKAFEENNLFKKSKGSDLRAGALTDIFMNSLRDRVSKEDGLDWGSENEDKLYRRAVKWHEDYINDFAPEIHPEIVEEKFEKEVKLGDLRFTLSGIVDLGYSKKVSDYKTTSSYGLRTKQKEIDDDLQLSYYSFASGFKDVENICLVKDENPRVVIVPSTRNKSQIAWALKIAGEVLMAIQKGAFPQCNPVSWVCSEKYCGYWKHCRGKV